MRDIYLVDFENVASDGLSGITYLSEEDQVIIFYSANSNRLSMKMHILIGKSVCTLNYFEVSVGGKNALDHQIATWLGYLIGTGAAERYFIVSRDMGYKHVANFWAVNDGRPKVFCADNIRGAIRMGRNMKSREQPGARQEEQAEEPEFHEEPELLPEPEETPAAPEAVRETPVTEVIPEAAAEMETSEIPAPVLFVSPAVPVHTAPEAAAGPVVLFQNVDLTPDPVPAFREPPKEDTPRAAEQPEKTPSPEQPKEEASRAPAEPEEGNGWEPAIGEELPKESPKPQRRRSTAGHGTRRQEVRNGRKQEQKADSHGGKTGQLRVRQEKAPARQEKPRLDQLHVLIAPYPELQENTLRELIQTNKRQVLCNTLRKQLGQEKGLALYNEIKKSAWK